MHFLALCLLRLTLNSRWQNLNHFDVAPLELFAKTQDPVVEGSFGSAVIRASQDGHEC